MIAIAGMAPTAAPATRPWTAGFSLESRALGSFPLGAFRPLTDGTLNLGTSSFGSEMLGASTFGSEMLGSSTERGAIVLAAVSKMFVGELVENARERMTAAGETGPIQPSHLRQAHRQAQRDGTLPPSATRHSARLFWRSDCGS